MAGRSHQASSEGIKKAKQALDEKSLNQVSLAEDLKFSRATVNNFFAGKPVDRKYFSQICEKLGFEWEEIVTKPPTEPETNQDSSINIDALVQDVRETIKPLIQERCGTMRVLYMTQPIGLNDIYTNVNFERITGKRRKKIAELLKDCKSEDFERFELGKITEKRVPGLEAVKKYSKLMLLGKPGAGKTTFLKYLAIQFYKKLSVQRKEDLLSKIALTTFERSDYFFKQKVAEQYITEYIRNLPDANTDPEALQLDSEKVLKSIEAQHGLLVERAKGIYSFSHLTFHEYLTAREFVVVKQSSDEALQSLVNHITSKRWREVFLLAVGMSPSADNLLQLMKQKVDALIATDKKLQQFLMWVSQKSVSVECPLKLTSCI